VFAAFLTTVLFSFSAVCGHKSAKLIGGTEANFWRISFASAFLAVWAYGFGKGLTGSALPMFLMSGILGIGLGDVAYFQALPRLGPRLSLLLVQCLTAPFGALIEWLWLGTTLTLWQMLFGMMILTGVGLALMPGEHLKLTRQELTWGSLAGVLAALGGAGGAVLSRKAYAVVHANGEHIDGMSAGFQRVLGGLLLSGLCLLVVKRRELPFRSLASGEFAGGRPKTKWRGVWFWILLNSLAGQTFGVSCMLWALETTPTGIVLPIIAMAPIAVIPIALIVEGERPSLRSLIGSAIAVAGVIALTLSR
jgi:drug/metabolite transporter (DMT)-like permease